jgi:hypothetical protein
LKAEDIAQRLQLPLATVETLLDDLRKHLFFLVLDPAGKVSWAFPVTAEKTPHRLRFSSGEMIFAAWAEDAVATPFVQGRLRNEHLTVEVETSCAHCGREFHLTLDSELEWRVKEADVDPLLFEPDVDWKHFDKPNILGNYWSNSVFFWSEEHARDFRMSHHQVDGTYLALEQGVYATRIAQSALFGFNDSMNL